MEKKGQFIVYSLNTTLMDDLIQFFMDLKWLLPKPGTISKKN